MFNERYFSNLHNMIIPLYGFNHYHSASNCEEDTEGFIGRDSIVDKLSAWLKAPEGSVYSGAYLITGYRGMGKSSFVHKAVAKLSPKPNGFIERIKKLKKPKYVTVTVNVGNELLSTKELLGMICKVAAKKFEEEATGRKAIRLSHRSNLVIATITWMLVVFLFIYWVYHVSTAHLGLFDKIFGSSLRIWSVYSIGIFGILSSAWISNRILSALWHLTKWKFFITIGQIKRYWQYLIERIEKKNLGQLHVVK